MTKGLEMAQITWTKSRDTGVDKSDAATAGASAASVIAAVIDGKVDDDDDDDTATSFEAKPEGGLRQSKHKGLMLTMLEDETPEEEEDDEYEYVSIAICEPPASSIPTIDDEAAPFILHRSHRQTLHQSLPSLPPPPSSP